VSNTSQTPVSIQSLRHELIRIAAEIVRGTNMPSEHWDDHPWQKTTGINERRRVLKQAEKANEQCREWAVRLRNLSGKLGDISHG